MSPPQGDRERVGELKAWWKANFGRVELKLEQLDEEFVRRQRMASLTVRLIEKVYAGVEKYVLRVSDGSACPLTTRGVRTTGCVKYAHCQTFLFTTTLQSLMNTKLSKHRFWLCRENRLIKTILSIPHNLYVSVESASLYCGLG